MNTSEVCDKNTIKDILSVLEKNQITYTWMNIKLLNYIHRLETEVSMFYNNKHVVDSIRSEFDI